MPEEDSVTIYIIARDEFTPAAAAAKQGASDLGDATEEAGTRVAGAAITGTRHLGALNAGLRGAAHLARIMGEDGAADLLRAASAALHVVNAVERIGRATKAVGTIGAVGTVASAAGGAGVGAAAVGTAAVSVAPAVAVMNTASAGFAVAASGASASMTTVSGAAAQSATALEGTAASATQAAAAMRAAGAASATQGVGAAAGGGGLLGRAGAFATNPYVIAGVVALGVGAIVANELSKKPPLGPRAVTIVNNITVDARDTISDHRALAEEIVRQVEGGVGTRSRFPDER